MNFISGPWKTKIEPNGRTWVIDGLLHDALGIAIVYGDDPTEEKANANLIAAAPEMYEALCMVLDADGDMDAIDFQQIRDAINKAEGRQP